MKLSFVVTTSNISLIVQTLSSYWLSGLFFLYRKYLGYTAAMCEMEMSRRSALTQEQISMLYRNIHFGISIFYCRENFLLHLH